MPVFKHQFTISATTDWQSIRATGLGIQGYLVAATYRLKDSPGPVNGNFEVMLTDRLVPDGLSSAQINAAGREQMFYAEDTIALVNSATAVTSTDISTARGEGAYYETQRQETLSLPQSPLLMVRGDGTLQGEVIVVLRSISTRRA